jgi:hypothetical protein
MSLQAPRQRTLVQRCGMESAMPLLMIFIAVGILIGATAFEILTRWF